jgi:hypothetical protein
VETIITTACAYNFGRGRDKNATDSHNYCEKADIKSELYGGATSMPISILQLDTPDGVVRAVVDLDRWRTAVEVAQKLRGAGVNVG